MTIDKTNTPDEIVDVVNENDEVIGEAAKKEVNSNPNLIHREIAIIIYDNDKKVLVQKRSEKKVVDPGLWTISVCGHVPKGERVEDAALMELKEELGLEADLRLILKKLIRYDNETQIEHLFEGKYSGEKINFEKEEIQEIRFISEGELEKMIASGEKFEPYSEMWLKQFWKGEI